MSEWKKVRLGDVGQIITGKTPLTKVSSYYDGLIHFVSPVDLNGCDKNILYTAKTISNSGLQSIKGCILPKGTICVSCIGNLGYVGITTMECASNQQINSIIVDESRFDLDFIYYVIKHLWRYFKSQENQSTTISIINKSTFSNIEIYAPSLEIQKKIASILSSLDDKIECNRRINENLEQQAQALFKSWFVDFEPFKDQPFVESELGMIPQGWKVVELGDLVEIIDNRGKTPPLESKDLYPIIDVKALTGPGRVLDYNKCSKYVNHETYTSWFRSGHPKKYDILLSTVGSLAETKLFMGGNGCIAQNVVALRNDYISLFLYDYLNRIKSDLVAYNIGSVQPSIKVTHIIKHKIILPQADVLDKYISLSRKLTENIYNYSYEIDNLSSLRDELLPKLMSGELNVENVNF